MSLKKLKDLKKIVEHKQVIIDCDYLVVGDDLFSLLTVLGLKKKFPDQNILWIGDSFLESPTITSLLNEIKYPSLLREESEIEKIKELFLLETVEKNSSLFFKDLKWRSFDGRAKPEEILKGEDFFIWPSCDIDIAELILKMFGDSIACDILYNQKVIQKIERSENGPKVLCFDGDCINCKKIYFTKRPDKLLTIMRDQLNSKEIEFCEAFAAGMMFRAMWNVAYDADILKETIFLPLSYTHSWGHFIGECRKNIEGNYSLGFVHFINEEDVSESDVLKRLKLLKSALEKVFPNILKNVSSEFITLKDSPVILYDKESKANLEQLEIADVVFIGQYDLKNDFHSPLGRGIASIKSLL